MAPHLTETMFALDQGARVIAIGDFDDYPAEVDALPRVGGYINPHLEQITLLSPEMILLPGEHPQVSRYAELNRIPVLNVNMDSLASIDAGIATLGEAFGAQAQADTLRAWLHAEIEALQSATHGLTPVKTLIITTRQSHDLTTLYTAGGPSFVSEIVELAGGENIYGDAAQNYLEASKETVVVRAPEVILEFHCGEGLDAAAQQAYRDDWNVLAGLPAVTNDRVCLILEAHGLRPGPRIVEIARMLARRLHPGIELPE